MQCSRHLCDIRATPKLPLAIAEADVASVSRGPAEARMVIQLADSPDKVRHVSIEIEESALANRRRPTASGIRLYSVSRQILRIPCQLLFQPMRVSESKSSMSASRLEYARSRSGSISLCQRRSQAVVHAGSVVRPIRRLPSGKLAAKALEDRL